MRGEEKMEWWFELAGTYKQHLAVPACGENCVGFESKKVVTDLNWRTPNRLRSAKNVNKCGQNVSGALFLGRIHNPKVGGSIPPPLPLNQ
jgi:hypothetical protein